MEWNAVYGAKNRQQAEKADCNVDGESCKIWIMIDWRFKSENELVDEFSNDLLLIIWRFFQKYFYR